MKVRLPIISNLSGADIHYQLLSEGLTAQGVKTDLHFYPHIMEFLPYRALQPFVRSSSDCSLVHSKAEYGWLFAEKGKPLVVNLAHSVFDPVYENYKNPVKRLYHNLKMKGNILRSLARAERVTTVSHFSARNITEHFGYQGVRVIYEGLDETFFRPPEAPPAKPDDRVRLFYAGNCIRRKGWDLMAPILRGLGDGFVLEYTSGLRTENTPPPHPAMVPLGKLSKQELLRAYQRCDIFLFPSRLEGFGRPAAEAMACGKPVVTTNYSSLPELVDDGKGGYLCPLDDVDAFVESIRKLARDPDARARMGAYNRAKVEQKFTLTGWIQRCLELYKEVV